MQPEDLVDVIAEAVKVATAPLVARIALLEREKASPVRGEKGEAGERGEKGEPGESINPAVLSGLLADIAELKSSLDRLRSEWPDIDWVTNLVAVKVAEAVASIPKPKDGERGLDGAPGNDGRDGTSVTLADVQPLIAEGVAKAVDSLPRAVDGVDGKPGVGIVSALIDRAGHLVLAMSDGQSKDVGLVVGRDADPDQIKQQIASQLSEWPRPKDGIDGKDGFGFDDMDIVHDGERGFTFEWTKGDRKAIKGPFTIASMIHRGTWSAEKRYEHQDVVTWGGSQWVCMQAKAAGKPGDQNSGWILSVKKGDIGREGKQGPKGERGERGTQGERGPERW